MTTIAMLLTLWTCNARSMNGGEFTATGTTHRQARHAVLSACRAHHAVCRVTACAHN